MSNNDDFFYDVKNRLEKNALTYMSLSDYKQSLEHMNCKELKQHNYKNARVPAEEFEKKRVYEQVLKEKNCNADADDNAIAFTIHYITKIADELDKNGFVEMANMLDEVLQKFAVLTCKDCK